jgi:tRNA(Ile)-lysidine synthase
MVEDASIMVYQQVARQEEEGIYFDLNQLRKLPNYNSIYTSGCMNLVSLLGMIYDLVESQSGKYVFLLSFDY